MLGNDQRQDHEGRGGWSGSGIVGGPPTIPDHPPTREGVASGNSIDHFFTCSKQVAPLAATAAGTDPQPLLSSDLVDGSQQAGSPPKSGPAAGARGSSTTTRTTEQSKSTPTGAGSIRKKINPTFFHCSLMGRSSRGVADKQAVAERTRMLMATHKLLLGIVERATMTANLTGVQEIMQAVKPGNEQTAEELALKLEEDNVRKAVDQLELVQGVTKTVLADLAGAHSILGALMNKSEGAAVEEVCSDHDGPL